MLSPLRYAPVFGFAVSRLVRAHLQLLQTHFYSSRTSRSSARLSLGFGEPRDYWQI
jgi:hypothetical protein